MKKFMLNTAQRKHNKLNNQVNNKLLVKLRYYM